MSLAALIQTSRTDCTGHQCKTCIVLGRLTPQDRGDFAQYAQDGETAAVLTRALNARLAELGIDLTIGPQSVREHIRRGHTA
jgi:hypothetical protein